MNTEFIKSPESRDIWVEMVTRQLVQYLYQSGYQADMQAAQSCMEYEYDNRVGTIQGWGTRVYNVGDDVYKCMISNGASKAGAQKMYDLIDANLNSLIDKGNAGEEAIITGETIVSCYDTLSATQKVTYWTYRTNPLLSTKSDEYLCNVVKSGSTVLDELIKEVEDVIPDLPNPFSCVEGDTKCDGTTKKVCKSGSWVTEKLQSEECGYKPSKEDTTECPRGERYGASFWETLFGCPKGYQKDVSPLGNVDCVCVSKLEDKDKDWLTKLEEYAGLIMVVGLIIVLFLIFRPKTSTSTSPVVITT